MLEQGWPGSLEHGRMDKDKYIGGLYIMKRFWLIVSLFPVISLAASAMDVSPVDRADWELASSVTSLSERKPEKKKHNDKEWLPAILKKGEFGIEVDRMLGPMNMVHLQNTWLFLLERGFLETTLPYIGRMHSPNLAINHQRAMEIKAPIIGYRVEALKRGSYRVRFQVRQVGEVFDIEIRVNRDAGATIYISSSIRSDARYSGVVKMIPGKGL